MCNKLSIIDIKDEVLQDYKKVSMLISASKCDFKCCKELGNTICQNSSLAHQPIKQFTYEWVYDRYINNHLSKAIIFGGLEPMLQFDEVEGFIKFIRNKGCNDDIVIYTGYNKDEITDYVDRLRQYINIIIKFGRFIPNDESRYDSVLGINLASKNQYAEKIS